MVLVICLNSIYHLLGIRTFGAETKYDPTVPDSFFVLFFFWTTLFCALIVTIVAALKCFISYECLGIEVKDLLGVVPPY